MNTQNNQNEAANLEPFVDTVTSDFLVHLRSMLATKRPEEICYVETKQLSPDSIQIQISANKTGGLWYRRLKEIYPIK